MNANFLIGPRRGRRGSGWEFAVAETFHRLAASSKCIFMQSSSVRVPPSTPDMR